jgi:hypothetical protein
MGQFFNVSGGIYVKKIMPHNWAIMRINMGYYQEPIWISLRDGPCGLLAVAHDYMKGVLRYMKILIFPI